MTSHLVVPAKADIQSFSIALAALDSGCPLRGGWDDEIVVRFSGDQPG